MSVNGNESEAFKKYREYLGDTVNYETGEIDVLKIKQKAYDEKDKLNILLIGATGAGKSSLVNAVFGYDVAKTGMGQPVTQHLEKFVLPEKGLTFWDTKGIEAKDYDATFNQLKNELHEALEKAAKSANPVDELPHVAWLCISERSTRVEGREFELLALMRKHKIPTVVVFTQSQREATEAFYQAAKELIDGQFSPFMRDRYVRVNSIAYQFMGINIDKFGLDELIKMTLDCLPEGKENGHERVNNYRAALLKAQIVDNEKKLKAMVDGATKKVNFATAAASAAGAAPIPFSDMVLISAIQVNMIYGINTEFEVEGELNSITSTLMGVLGTTGLAQLGRSVVGSLLKLIPGAGSVVGGAISGVVAAGITKAIGEAYIKVLVQYYNKETGKVEVPDDMTNFLGMFKTAYETKKPK